MTKMHLKSFAEQKTSKKPNGPLRTVREIADEFGVHLSVLNHIMGTTKISPPAPWSRSNSTVVTNTYYELRAMRAWWKAYQASKEPA